MNWRIAVACGALTLGLSAQPQADLPPELRTLARIKARMKDMLSRQPNYTCSEQVERTHRGVPGEKDDFQDVLRIEVAFVNGKELYSWPGEGKFEERDITTLVREGPIGNGYFALFTNSVFAGNAPVFHYAGEDDVNGVHAYRYDYSVPLLLSGFDVVVGQRKARVGFSGSFWADARTLELLRLNVHAEEIPTELRLEECFINIYFASTRMGETDFVLPERAEMTMLGKRGEESRNAVRFSACRQYLGQSVITFSETPMDEAKIRAGAPAEPQRAHVRVPGGIDVEVTLDEDINIAAPPLGEIIHATLRTPLVAGGERLFAKGAKLTGRLIKVERRNRYCVLGVQFSRIESPELEGELNTVLLHSIPNPRLRRNTVPKGETMVFITR